MAFGPSNHTLDSCIKGTFVRRLQKTSLGSGTSGPNWPTWKL